MKFLNVLFVALIVFLIACGISEEELEKTKENKVVNISKSNVSKSNLSINATKPNITQNVSSNASNITKVQPQPEAIGNLTVEFLYFIEGNSILIKTPATKFVVIDGGTNRDGLYLVKYFRNFTGKIEHSILTNAKDNNVGGMDSVITNFNDTHVYSSGITDGSNAYKNFESAAKYLTLGMINITKDNELKLDNNVSIHFFVPFNATPFESHEENTLVIKINYKKASFLLMGDCTGKCIDAMRQKEIKAGVLKANHELPIDFVNAVNPSVVVFDKVVNTSIYSNKKVYTRSNGIVSIRTDGTSYYISTEK